MVALFVVPFEVQAQNISFFNSLNVPLLDSEVSA